MHPPLTRVLAVPALVAFALVALVAAPALAAPPAGSTVIASGLTNPRGFTWGADGTLYVGLGGTGGAGQGLAAGTPTGFTGGTTASVVAIANGCVTTVAKGLPSSELTAAGWTWGVNDVAILNGQLYALDGGGGPNHGMPQSPNGVYRINADGSTALVADLGSWFASHPPKFIAPDYAPDGSLFGMAAGNGALWISEAVGGRVLRVTPAGDISLIADLSTGHLVPSGIALAPDGGVYVGYETSQPYVDGASKISHVAPDGTVTDVWTGLTMVSGVAVASDGTLYAEEMATGNSGSAPFVHADTGKVVKQTGPSTAAEVATGLDYPVALRFGPDGGLYVGLPAFAAAKGQGAGMIVRLGGGGSTPIAATALACATPTS